MIAPETRAGTAYSERLQMMTTHMWRCSYILSSARSTHTSLLLLRQPLPPPTLFERPKRHFFPSSGITFPVLKAATTNASSWWSSSNGSTTISHFPSNYGCRKLLKLGFDQVGSRRFTTGTTHVNDPGSIDSPLIQSMEKKICTDRLLSNAKHHELWNLDGYGTCGFMTRVRVILLVRCQLASSILYQRALTTSPISQCSLKRSLHIDDALCGQRCTLDLETSLLVIPRNPNLVLDLSKIPYLPVFHKVTVQ